MVNTINLSLYKGSPPQGGGDRKISDGPLYSDEELLPLLEDIENTIRAVTIKCRDDIQDLALGDEELSDLIDACLKCGKFIGAEWCEGTKANIWYACDAYSVVRSEWNKHANRYFNIEYYLKFAIGKTGKLIMMASCHLSK